MQLPKPILYEVGMYYALRELAERMKNPNWNKGARLRAISEACEEVGGWTWEASAGTFWFYNGLDDSKNCTIMIDSKNFPIGEDRQANRIKCHLDK